MLATQRTICSRDCYANCGLIVTVNDGKAIGLRGDPSHPYNHGLACAKSRRFLDLIYSPARIRKPLLQRDDRFIPIGWDEALGLLAEKLEQAKSAFGPTSVLHYSDYAHSGVLHNSLGRRFFRAFGGCTRPVGSLCMSAGTAALEAAFGRLANGDVKYLEQAGSIILWGANPAVTNVPLLSYLRSAKKAGVRIYVIDPICTETAAIADYHIQPRPGSDVELALGLAKSMIDAGSFDNLFVSDYAQDYLAFVKVIDNVSPEIIEKATGLSWAMVRSLAQELSQRLPLSVIPGFGLQRRGNGAQIIWAIASLVALTGSFGQPGGGLYYAHSCWDVLGDISGSDEYSYFDRTIARAATGSELLRLGSQIQVAVINQANPLMQNPAPDLVAQALDQVPFVAVFDQFLTPTAKAANLVLPTTSFLEGEDLIINSWHHYLALSLPAIAPWGESRSDPEIFIALARLLGLFSTSSQELLDHVIKPLAPFGVTRDLLAEGPWRYPAPGVQWEGKRFNTPSGKFRFWDGQAPGFEYRHPNPDRQETFPYILLTPQSAKGTHSQGIVLQTGNVLEFFVHPRTAETANLRSDQKVVVETARAAVSGIVHLDDRIHPEVVLSYNGSWPRTVKAGLNVLISERISTAGNQAAMYDCPCMIRGR